MEPNIQLAKPRDFGEIIGDTFLFIRQNFKELLKNYFTFCGIFMLIGGAAFAMLQFKNNSIASGNAAPNTFGDLSGFLSASVIIMVVSVLTFTTSITTIVSYMAIYKQKGNLTPTTEEVWNFVKYYFFRVLLANFILGLLLVVAYMFCLIPGIWLFPIFGLVTPIMIMENQDFGSAFSRAFNIIKNYWWETAGALLVIWIIAYVMAMVFTLPASAANMASIFLGTYNHTSLSAGSIIFGAVLQQFAMLIYIIPYIGICLLYYNLTERKEGTTLLDRIDRFGQYNADSGLPSEEY